MSGNLVKLFHSASNLDLFRQCINQKASYTPSVVVRNLKVLLNCVRDPSNHVYHVRSQYLSVKSFSPQICSRKYSSTAGVKETNQSATDRLKKEKLESKKKESPKILLVDEKGGVSGVTLEEAGKIAKKRRLQLIEIDPHTEKLQTEKQVYKLMTASEFYGEEVKHVHKKADSKQKLKDEKTLLMKSTTNEHDVLVKVKQIEKWIQKNHPVKILLGQPGEGGSPENVYKIIENAVKDLPVRIVQKVVKQGQIRFQILPPKETKAPAQPKAGQKPKSDAMKAENETDEDSASDDESKSK